MILRKRQRQSLSGDGNHSTAIAIAGRNLRACRRGEGVGAANILDIEADRGDSGDNLAQLQLVEDGRLLSREAKQKEQR